MQNKVELELFTISGCSRCQNVKYQLEREDIIYHEHSCTSQEDKKCDSLEDKIDCGRYPIAVIKKNGVTTIVHNCYHKKPSGTSVRKIPVDSEDKFIDEVKKAYFS